jgi:hypothetical protein
LFLVHLSLNGICANDLYSSAVIIVVPSFSPSVLLV